MGIIGNGGLTIFNSGSGGTNANVGNTPLFSVNVATTVALPSCVYDNGTSGVGATLVGSVIGALPSIDTVTPYVGMTVLVKNQASALQNGLYSVDKVGDSSSQKFVLTRLSIYDETSEIYPSQINILQGSANINFYFLQKTATPVVGTDSLVYEKLTIAGLTYFTEAQNTSAPNATVYVDSLTALSSTTDADISIVPKGTGAFQLAVPDNTTAGGNKRGLNSVDLQTASRSSANQVASGNYVSLLGGYRNRATGNYSVTAGNQNLTSGQSSVALGELLTASATGSIALGTSCISSGSYSFSSGLQSTASNSYAIAMGYLCTASGQSSVSLGQSNTASDYASSIGFSNTTTSNSASVGHSNVHNGANYGYAYGRGNTVGASATNSFVAGFNNLVSADRATAIGGGVTASGIASTAIGGQSNSATAQYSTSVGGQNNIANIQNATVIGGSGNTASGAYSFATGLNNTSSSSATIAMGSVCTASGAYSIAMGYQNIASGQYGATIGGTANNNSGIYGALCTGWSNVMSSTGGFVGGYSCNHSGSYGITMGYQSSNSGQQSIVIGQSITSSALYSLAVGNNHAVTGQNNSVTGSGGVTINGGGRQVQAYFNTVAGDAQNTKMVLTKRTTDATLTPLTVGGTAPYFGQNEFTLQDNSCVRFNGTIVGKQTGSSNIAVWDINGVISKIGGTVTININNVNVVTNPSIWGTPTLSVNGAYGMSVNVIGKLATNIQWTAYLDCTEVVY